MAVLEKGVRNGALFLCAESKGKARESASRAVREGRVGMTIYQRIAAVMADVERLQADMRVQPGRGREYTVLSAEKANRAIRPLLLRHGIVILPIQYDVRRTDGTIIGFDGKPRPQSMTEMVVTYRVQSIDDAADFVDVQSCGQGIDMADKGIGKASTYADKYMLMRVFRLIVGDDPDRIASDVLVDEIMSCYQPEERHEAYDLDRLQTTIIALLRAQERPDADADREARRLYGVDFADCDGEQLTQLKITIAKEGRP